MRMSMNSAVRGVLAVMLGSALVGGCGGNPGQSSEQPVGQNSQGVSTNTPAPMNSSSLGSDVVSIACGNAHALAVKSDGTVWGWGMNAFGQLGLGSSSGFMYEEPVQVPGISNAKSVSSRAINSAVVLGNGDVLAWGTGALGNGTLSGDITRTPVRVSISGVDAVSVGESFCVALKQDKTVWAWGHSQRIGDGTGDAALTPVQVLGLSDVTAISAGALHAMALKNDGTVWIWGQNPDGILGLGDTATRYIPAQVPGLSNIKSISAGEGYSLAVDGNGNVWAWGSNSNGELGDGSTTLRTTPVMVKSGPSTFLSGIKSVVAGKERQVSLAVGVDGTLWAWGTNEHGQLGNGTTTDSSIAVQASTITNVRFANVGGGFALAVVNSDAAATSGAPWSWGSDSNGQLGNGSL